MLLIRAMTSAVYLFAADRAWLSGVVDNGLPLWGQLGIAAVFVVGFITLQIVPGVLYKRLQDDLTAERAYSRELESAFKEQALPLMLKYAAATEEMMGLVREMIADRNAETRLTAQERRRRTQ